MTAAKHGGGTGSAAGLGRRRAVHDVLAVASRALILEQVRAHGDGVDVAALAAATGLHPNTVRFHLDVLATAGMVQVSSRPAGGPGRPRLIFTAVRIPPPASGGPGASERDGYALLAKVLASQLAAVSAEPDLMAEAAGRLWAAEHQDPSWPPLVDEAPAGAPGVDDAAASAQMRRLTSVTALLDELGFAPRPVRGGDGWRIMLHRCPFHAMAAADPAVVCRMHLGLLQGAVDRLGGDGSEVRLEPFVAPELCEAFVPLSALSRPAT
jgi:predicted ArsR family transcriptional regulator